MVSAQYLIIYERVPV